MIRKLKKKIKSIILHFAFAKDYINFKRLSKDDGRFPILWKSRRPCLKEKT